jgi:hypothetical protein
MCLVNSHNFHQLLFPNSNDSKLYDFEKRA